MNSRERQLAAIRHEIPDRIPVDAIAVENCEAIAAALGIDPTAVPVCLGLDGRIVSAPCLHPRTTPDGHPMTEWGTLSGVGYGCLMLHPLAHASTTQEIESYAWPRVDDYDYAAAAREAAQLSQEYAVRGPYWVPLFCRVCDLFGMEEGMVKMIAEPVLFEAALEGVFQHVYQYCEALLYACGDSMPILCLGDDFATQRAMMISPDHWRTFLKPRYAKLFELGRRRGKFIWFHSCGNVVEVLPDLIDIGLDVWETVQLHTLPISASHLKAEYGKHITFFGGVNTQRLPWRTPDEVRDEVRRCIENLGRGGGYICGPDHHIKPDVPAENAVALFDEARAFTREGYTTP
ncbi:hypothetical protein HS125_07890 [bacterium]|nr:hypothetical protein [bacterium]